MKKRLLCITILLFIVVVQSVSAQEMVSSTGIPSVLDQIRTASLQFGQRMVKFGGQLLAGLSLLQVAWNGADRFMKGNLEIKAVLGNMVRTVTTTCFFFFILTQSLPMFTYIMAEWNRVGAAAAGIKDLDPGGLMAAGFSLAESMRAAAVAKMGNGLVDMLGSFAISLQLVLVYLFVIFTFFVLSAQLAMAMIKGYLWLCVGPLLLGFGGLKTTRDIAVNTLKAAISMGAIIVTTYSIAGIASLLVPVWNGLIAQFTIDNWVPFWGIVVSAGFLALTAWQVPKYANDFINGSVSGGISEIAGAGITAAAGVAAAASGAGLIAKAGVAGVSGGLGGVFQAISSGMAAAGDEGKTGIGGVVSGIGHAAGAATSMAGEKVVDMGKSVLEKFTSAQDGSIGQKVADRIQGERGGAISPSGMGGGSALDASLERPGGAGVSETSGLPGSAGGGRSMADRIKGMHDYLPSADSGSVTVSGMNAPTVDSD